MSIAYNTVNELLRLMIVSHSRWFSFHFDTMELGCHGNKFTGDKENVLLILKVQQLDTS